MSINIHLYQSTCTNESRILKIARSLSKKQYFDEIHIVGFFDKGLQRNEMIHDDIRIIRIKNFFHTVDPNSKLRYITLMEWNIRVFFLYLFKSVRCINAHSVPVLPVATLLKIMKRSLMVYDTHELETETETKGFSKALSKVIERLFINASDYTVVVGNSIKDWYRKRYNLLKLLVIKNIPNTYTVSNIIDLKKQLKIPADHLLFIYQGNLSELRGVNKIISVFKGLPEDKHIVFMGFGSLEKKIQKLASITHNIHYHQTVPPSEILSYTAGADVGIHIIPNSCLNNYYCLPNKLFEYTLAGIPFIGSNFPDIRSEFAVRNVAWLIEPDEESLLYMVKAITKEAVYQYKKNCFALRESLTWESQEPALFAMYDQLFLRKT